MIISWRYSQKIEILEYNLYNKEVNFKVLDCGANHELEVGKIYTIDYRCDDKVPDIARVIELIEIQYDIYLCD